MKRREFIAGLAMPLLITASAVAQQAGQVRRIGWLTNNQPETGPESNAQAFYDELRRRGWTEGRNLEVEYRYADHVIERFPSLADELVRLRADVLVVVSRPAALAAKAATSTIPIVFTTVGDPVGSGLVASLARPGGNLTGVTPATEQLSGKRFELLKEAFPRISRVATLTSGAAVVDADTIRAATASGLQLVPVDIERAEEIAPAIAAHHDVDAWFVVDVALFVGQRKTIINSIAALRKPAMYAQHLYVEAGGLMSYAPDLRDLFRRAAVYVDRILRGEKPANLPVEQPAKFEFVINLKTAKALDLAIPPLLLARADQVIE